MKKKQFLRLQITRRSARIHIHLNSGQVESGSDTCFLCSKGPAVSLLSYKPLYLA